MTDNKTVDLKRWWSDWKDNFCQHISDWSYNSADEELEHMKAVFLALLLEKMPKELEHDIESYDFTEGYNRCHDNMTEILKGVLK